jgi:hypothetical protein
LNHDAKVECDRSPLKAVVRRLPVDGGYGNYGLLLSYIASVIRSQPHNWRIHPSMEDLTMKNIKSAKSFQLSFLFLAISVLMLFSPLTSNAQNPSGSTNLEGTQWIAKPYNMVNVDASVTVLNFTYFFSEEGRVKLVTFATKGTGMSPVTGQLTLPVASSTEVFGTYKVNGKSVYLDFPNETISASIRGNLMKGVMTLKKTNKNEEWIVERELTPSLAGRTWNKANDLASANTRSSFTLSEFQNSYFKPIPLTQNTIAGTNPDGSLNYLNYFFIAGSGELTFTFVLRASRDSYASQVVVEVQDRKNNVVAKKFVTTHAGETEQASVSIDIAEKQAMFLRITLSGGGFYEVRLNGAIDFGQATSSSANSNKNISKPSRTQVDPVAASQDLIRGIVISNADGTLSPANGYQWVSPNDPKDVRVMLMPGLVKTEDGFRPAKGYRWVNPKDPKDFRIEPIP